MRTLPRRLLLTLLLAATPLLAGAPPDDPGDRFSPAGKPAAEPPLHPKLHPALDRALRSALPLEAAAERGFRVRDGRVQVWVRAAEGSVETLRRWLEETEEARWVSVSGATAQASVLPATLPRLDARPDVLRVERPLYLAKPVPAEARAARASPEPLAGAYTTEALGPMNVPAWHAAGKKGQGVRLGVVDLEFGGWAALAGSDLPAPSKLTYRAFGASQLVDTERHGTACAEIVHDVAPELDAMYLAQVETSVDVANAVAWLRQQGAKVISQSAGYNGGTPGDGTGPDRAHVDAFVNGGGVWVNAAGNAAYEHWQGAWRDVNGDSNLDLTDTGGRFRNFITYSNAQTTRIYIPSGIYLVGDLTWSQWTRPAADLDLYLYWSPDSSGQTVERVAESVDLQNGGDGQVPDEYVVYLTPRAGYYSWQVHRAGGAADGVDVELFTNAPLEFRVRSGSVTHPGDVPNAIAVAALDVTSPFALEAYSSAGPTNGPGGTLAGGTVKPDIAGFANVSTACYGAGEDRFNGTSSATPHVAGAAALVWGANPAYTNEQVRSYLVSSAADMGSAGKDNDYGSGRVLLGSPSSGGGGGGACTPDATTLCLYQGRFKLQATYRDYGGGGGAANAVALTADSGYFWFFSSSNVEVVAKIVRFCSGSSGNYGLYASGLTDVEVTFKVTDTTNGTYREYRNPLGTRFCTIADGPFTCP